MRHRERELLRHDAHDGALHVPEAYGPADHVRVPAEACLPDIVADDDNWRRACKFVRFDEKAAKQRPHACRPEGGRADLRNSDRLADGLAPAVPHEKVAFGRAEGADVLDGLELVAPGDKVVQRARLLAARDHVPELDPHDTVPIGQRQPGVQPLSDELECARADPDCERHRQPADHRQPRIPRQHPEAQLEVQPRESKPIEVMQTTRRARFFLVSFRIAELTARAP